MALLPILEFPDIRLRTIATPVEDIDNRIIKIVDDMLETMYDASGVGLAGTQVDIHKQIIVIDVSEDKNEPLVFINPKIDVLDDEDFQYQEGCLSIPGFYEDIARPKYIRVTALNKQGKTFTIEPENLLAVCIQHEIDHLNGKLFVDHISSLKRQRIRKKMDKKHKQSA